MRRTNSTDNFRKSVNGLMQRLRKSVARLRGAVFLISCSLFWEGRRRGPERPVRYAFTKWRNRGKWDNPSGEIPRESKRIPPRSPGIFGYLNDRRSGKYLKKREGEGRRYLYHSARAYEF